MAPQPESVGAEQLLSKVRDAVFQSAQLPLMTLVYSQSFHQVTPLPHALHGKVVAVF